MQGSVFGDEDVLKMERLHNTQHTDTYRAACCERINFVTCELYLRKVIMTSALAKEEGEIEGPRRAEARLDTNAVWAGIGGS
jgi:hypothetical protein